MFFICEESCLLFVFTFLSRKFNLLLMKIIFLQFQLQKLILLHLYPIILFYNFRYFIHLRISNNDSFLKEHHHLKLSPFLFHHLFCIFCVSLFQYFLVINYFHLSFYHSIQSLSYLIFHLRQKLMITQDSSFLPKILSI